MRNTFSGVNHFVDVSNAVQTHDVYRPNDRALNPSKGTTLSLGVKQTDLRTIFYATCNVNPRYNKTEVEDIQKCEAVCNLLSLWYSDNCNTDGEITSLGICSDGGRNWKTMLFLISYINRLLIGTFGIPAGIFFSQPVCLRDREDKSRVWVPCPEFPVPSREIFIFNNLIKTAEILVEKLARSSRSAISPQK